MIIAIDFDGTLCDHRYPSIGIENPGAINLLKEWSQSGHKLILLTMRSNEYLEEAVKWCADRGITFWAVNENPDQDNWTSSRKVYAHLYIDDAALGVPLKESPRMGGRPVVDWDKVKELVNVAILRKSQR